MTQDTGEWKFTGQRWVYVNSSSLPSTDETANPYAWALPPAPDELQQMYAQRQETARWQWPVFFYILTWLSTTWVGSFMYGTGGLASGLYFSVPLMIILTCHELGHYVQAKRYKVFSTLPLFIPIPLPPFGTFGAVIRMDSRIPNIRALYDIGISGPLAGLIPTLLFLLVGISMSSVEAVDPSVGGIQFGEPLLFRWVSMLFFDRSVPGTDLILNPIAMAAWTGLFITSLNLLPVGQLDGGHVFYALLKRRAAFFSSILFFTTSVVIIVTGQWNWILMLLLVMFFGIDHPPTCDDSQPLDPIRKYLGIATLLFILIGFTPTPIIDTPAPPKPTKPK
ncbi:MAG: site-2 protease family protein [Planctomycetia bacterium]|nr:site-2 protease family protein [Planctomycetia bacterium]